jgi:tetratricopeptide (TPR) repeat protein
MNSFLREDLLIRDNSNLCNESRLAIEFCNTARFFIDVAPFMRGNIVIAQREFATLGDNCLLTHDYSNALDNYLNALKFYQKTSVIEDQENLLNLTKKIANCYLKGNRYQEALDYFNRYLTLITPILVNDEIIFNNYSNLADAFDNIIEIANKTNNSSLKAQYLLERENLELIYSRFHHTTESNPISSLGEIEHSNPVVTTPIQIEINRIIPERIVKNLRIKFEELNNSEVNTASNPNSARLSSLNLSSLSTEAFVNSHLNNNINPDRKSVV